MSRPFMPFYDGDWMRDTAHLSDTEERAYFRLVMFYWANGELPMQERHLARICHADDIRKWKKLRPTLLALFTLSCEGKWVHKRIELELEKSRKFQEKQRMNGAKPKAKSKPNASQTETRARVPQPQPLLSSLRSDNSSFSLSSNETRAKKSNEFDDEFTDRFWPLYPHKVGKPAALRAFRTARKKTTLDEIMAGLERYKRAKPAERQWLNPTTFLNQERFNDEMAKPAHDPWIDQKTGLRIHMV